MQKCRKIVSAILYYNYHCYVWYPDLLNSNPPPFITHASTHASTPITTHPVTHPVTHPNPATQSPTHTFQYCIPYQQYTSSQSAVLLVGRTSAEDYVDIFGPSHPWRVHHTSLPMSDTITQATGSNPDARLTTSLVVT